MYIDIYIDETPLWGLGDNEIIYYIENICTIDVPESILREWYEEGDGFEEWYNDEYTLDETIGLYDFCIKRNCKPKILFEDEWKKYLKKVKENYYENC